MCLDTVNIQAYPKRYFDIFTSPNFHLRIVGSQEIKVLFIH